MYQRKWSLCSDPLCAANRRDRLPAETTLVTVPPQGPWIFFNKSFLFGHFFLPLIQDIAIPSQKGRNRKLGDVYSSSVLGNRCSLLSAIWSLSLGRRNFFAGILLAESQNACREKFAGEQIGIAEPEG